MNNHGESLVNVEVKSMTAMLLKDRRIFVVEDNLDNRVITRIALLRQGAVLEFDRWGHETLLRLNIFAPVDVILLDLMFPNHISGYTIFEKIHSEPAYTEVPIIAVSAADPARAIPKCRELGFKGFIAKPIDDDLFAEQIVKILNGQEVWYAG